MSNLQVDLSQLAVQAPPTPSKSGYKLIPLTQGLFALVSPEDYNYLRRVRWHARKDGNTFYAARRRPRDESGTEFIMMHKLIAESLGLLSDEQPEVDHINHNGLDNRRTNLRAASRSDNAHNRRHAKGYTYDPHGKKPYKVVVAKKYIGRFATEEEAVAAYWAEKERLGYGQH